jgi:hypothetical protein
MAWHQSVVHLRPKRPLYVKAVLLHLKYQDDNYEDGVDHEEGGTGLNVVWQLENENVMFHQDLVPKFRESTLNTLLFFRIYRDRLEVPLDEVRPEIFLLRV